MLSRTMQIALVSLSLFAVAPRAGAVYINPTPNAMGLNLASPIANATVPQAGIVGDFLGMGGALQEFCSSSLVHSNIMPQPDWVLTAGHCVTQTNAAGADIGLTPNPSGSYRQGGPGGVVFGTNQVRRHAFYNHAALNNDLGLMRLSANTGLAGLPLRRNAPAVGAAFAAIGFGTISNTGALPISRNNDIGFGTTKRAAIFNVNGFVGGAAATFRNSTQFLLAGNFTPANPTRQICGGDSGGPSLINGIIAGVHSYGTFNNTNNACFGTIDGPMGDANVTTPFMHNWIDSYTRKAIFWDRLQIDGAVVDTFEPVPTGDGTGGPGQLDPVEYMLGGNGVADEWRLANDNSVNHPQIGPIGPNPNGWRYMNSIGTDNMQNAELWTDVLSGQGEIMLGGGASLIFKRFTVMGGAMIDIQVDQRWNSLGLQDDLGVRLPNGTFVWDGLATSALGNLDQWFTRSLTVDLTAFTGQQTIGVYLLNVPEPGAVSLLAVGLMLLPRRRRSR